jgi:hypothetical protein
MCKVMSISLLARRALVCCCLAAAIPAVVLGQTNYVTNGVEYPVAGVLPQDQAHPHLSLNQSGGYLVWQDNITDGDHLGISALRLDGGFSGVLSPFRVNSIGAGDQQNPQVSLLKGGGVVFVWQGGQQGFQRIYARYLSSGSLWLGPDILVNTFNGNSQVNPVVATLTNGNVVVAWASFNQASPTSFQDVYAQMLSPTGGKINGEFPVNQFTSYNQRNPAIAALSDGRFVMVWVSEQQRVLDAQDNTAGLSGTASVDVYARIFSAGGSPAGNEFLVNTTANLCSSPHVAAGNGGTFMVVWAEKDRMAGTNGWDILARTFSSAGTGGTVRYVNSTRVGDQYLPSISFDGMDYLVIWTSLGQDDSREGVFGQFLNNDGTPDWFEFRVNTTWVSQQMQPVAASDGQGRFLAAWTGYIGGVGRFDLFAQRYVNAAQPLPALAAPFVFVPFVVSNGAYQPQIEISWPVQAGLSIDHYDVYVDGVLTAAVTTNTWLMTAANGLAASTTHSFQVDYVTTSSRVSPISLSSSATTWTTQIYRSLLPAEWMAQYWGYGNPWPLPTDPVAPGGPTVMQVFLTGADPTNPATWLRTAVTSTAQGYFLTWNTRPGLTYQVQSSTDLKSWGNLGSPRFALGANDSLYLGVSNPGYYRVMKLR